MLAWSSSSTALTFAVIFQGTKFVTARIANRQEAVSMATQTRISTTKAILDSMKNIKMMGLTNKMGAKIEAARNFEIKMYLRLNRLFVAFNASGE